MFALPSKALSKLQPFLDAVPSPVFVKNRDHRIVLLNDSACAMFDRPREELVGYSDWELQPEEFVRGYHAADVSVFETGEDFEVEERAVGGDGQLRHLVTRKRRVSLNGDHYLIAIVTDITEFRRAEAESRRLALHDTLTGLANRALLNDHVARALADRERSGPGCTLIYVDLDRFKEANDGYGHAAGDALLRGVADRLGKIARASDVVARLGGDEFAILARATRSGAAALCRRIVAAIAEPFDIAGAQLFVGASVGVAAADASVETADELHRRADVALYDAKNAGRGCYRAYSAQLDWDMRRRRGITTELRAALRSGTAFQVHFQPVVEGAAGRAASMEALVRWQHPLLGTLSPSEFVPIAEESGLIVPLGEWVLARAAEVMAPWPGIALAVNLSPVQLRSEGIVERILAIVDGAGLARERLQLELTETAIFGAEPQVADRLRALRQAGIKIVLDDFGTGYSSLAHLQKLEVDRVKIDRSFVSELASSADAGAIVEAVLGIGRTLGIAVTAEGVETEVQRDFLRAAGCQAFQGYLFSRPLDEAAATRFLRGEALARAA